MIKHYVDSEGNSLGSFDGATPPDGAIEVAIAPNHGLEIWNGSGWDAAPLSRGELMYAGVLIDGVMCSALKEDQWGLNSIKAFVVAGTDVPFEFVNGNTLTLTSSNIAAFEAAWIPFRFSFF